MTAYVVELSIITEDGVEPHQIAVDADSVFDAESLAHLIATEGEDLIVATVGPTEEVSPEAV